MSDSLRASFEQAFPLPSGVTWDGDHYAGSHQVAGSFTNASIWGHMWRGWKGHAGRVAV